MIYYYDDKTNTYATQFEALASRKKCKFYFYDHIFDQVDWTIEPSETLDELYRIRAQEIRDTYDYVILCYSGGHDSSNVLDVFYRNKIHIDEIVMVGSFSRDSSRETDENRNAEVYLNCFPNLKQMNLPNTKITLSDYAEPFAKPNNFTLIKKYGNEWIRHVGSQRSAFNIYWHDFKKFVDNKKEKKTCYILGCDKLGYTSMEKNGIATPCFRVNDSIITGYGATREMDNYQRVDFYISPNKTSLDIMRKQGHILIRSEKAGLFKAGLPISEWEPVYEKIIYNNIDKQVVYHSPKSLYSCISGRDSFVWNAGKGSDIHKLYFEGLKDLSKFISLETNPTIFSKPYFLQ
jgi:hypothetical protein